MKIGEESNVLWHFINSPYLFSPHFSFFDHSPTCSLTYSFLEPPFLNISDIMHGSESTNW